MKKLFPILLLCLCALSARAYTFVTLTFTNIPTNGCTWTLNGTTVLWTNAPLNSTTWIQTNGILGSATNLVRRLGAQYGYVSAVQTNSTNIIISGGTVQFSIVGNYGFCVTNALANNTNRILLDLPFDYMFDTNRTNAADALMYGLDKYALTNTFRPTAQALTNFVNRTNVQTVAHKTLTQSGLSGGSISNGTFATNMASVHSTNITAGKITATNGELTGVTISSAPTITSDLSYLTNLIVDTGMQVLGETELDGAVAIFGAMTVENSVTFRDEIQLYDTDGINYFALSATETNEFNLSSSQHGTAFYISNNIFGLRPVGYFTNGFVSYGTERLANVVRLSQSGPSVFDTGTYSSLTGGSNNNAQASSNVWLVISGQSSACNLNAIRTGDGLPMAGPLGTGFRPLKVFNGGAFTVTLIPESGFETFATNRFSLPLSANVALQPGDCVELAYSVSAARWVPAQQLSVAAVVTNVPPQSSVSITNNTASFTYSNSFLISGQFWTNTTGSRATIKIAWTLTGNAISGFPSLCMTNISSGEYHNPTNSFVLTASDSGRTDFDLSPGDYVIVTNKSSGSASAAIVSSWLTKW